MKKTIAVTVDLDNLLIAKEKLGDRQLSNYLNDCLRGLSDYNGKDRTVAKLQRDLNDLDKQLSDISVRKSILSVELHKAQEIEAEAVLQREREEFNKRWICPVCIKRVGEVLNVMSDDRCKNCNLPVRNSKSVTYKIIEEDK